MAAGLNTAGRNLMLDSGIAGFGFLSLHSADPGATGVNELTGGAPAYARKAITWAAAGSGSRASSNTQAFDVPASSTVAFVGYWSLATGGVFYGSRAVTSEAFVGQGTYTVASGITESVA